MKTLSGRCIRPFSSAFAVMQTNVSCEHLLGCIAANHRVAEEKKLLLRINACKEKIDQYIQRTLAISQNISRPYALLLLSGQWGYRKVFAAMLADLQVDELAQEIHALVRADMQHYFGRSVPECADLFTVSARLFSPPAYISQVLQEYRNTFRFTKTMGRVVNKTCRESLSHTGLPRVLRQLAGQMDWGDLLLSRLDCSPAEQVERLQRQVDDCIHGMLSHWATQITHQYQETAAEVYYRLYDEYTGKNVELPTINQYKLVHWKRRKKRHSLYEVPYAV